MAKFRRASDSEFWIAVRRLWTFEEPASRWIRLRKQLAKLSPNSMPPDADSIYAQEELFRAVLGDDLELSPIDSEVNLSISCAFALAESAIFADAAFAYCRPRELNNAHEQLVARIVQARKLSRPQECYLRHRIRVTPDWTRLAREGPWRGDARADFVRAVVDFARSELPWQSAQNGDGIEDGAYLRQSAVYAYFIQREKEERQRLPSAFLPRRLILVEGATEQILLPHFAKCISKNWDEEVILVIPAGGANQVTRRYPILRELTKLPVDCLLDGDVLSQAEAISAQLKNGDKLYVLRSGAIEEAFAREQIVELANTYFDGLGGAIYPPLSLQDLAAPTNQESLDRIWRKRNRGSFDKTGFAKVVAEEIVSPADIPGEIRQLITDLLAAK